MTTGLLNSCAKENLMYKAVLNGSYSCEDYKIYRIKLTLRIRAATSA